MQEYALFAMQILLYSAFPIYFGARRSSMRLVYLYAYISMVHVVGGVLGAVFALSLGSGVTVSGGSIAYGAFMMSTVVLVIVGRDLEVIRNVIKLVILTNLFKIGLFALTREALLNPGNVNPFDTSPLVFSASLKVVLIGGGLIVLELLFLVAVFQKSKDVVRDQRVLPLLYVGFFIAVLCLDGLVFPPLAFPGEPELAGLVAASVKGKLVLGLAFGVPLAGFLLAFRSTLFARGLAPLTLTDLFVSPREKLVQEIGRQHSRLERSEEEYKQLAESIDEILFSLDQDLRFTYWNKAAEGLTYSASEVLGRKYIDVFPQTQLLPLFMETMRTKVPARVRQNSQLPSGERIVLDVSAFPSEQGVTVLARDVTEAVRLQEQLLHSQKMEAVGQLAGGIAHDFNNLLSVINNYAALIQESLPEDDRNRADLDEVLKAGQRAADLVQQLLTFSRVEEIDPTRLRLDQVIVEMEGLIRRAVPESIEVDIDLGSDAVVVMDLSQLEQAILNLVVNARDAMPAGGRLKLETVTRRLDDDEAAARGGRAGDYAVIRITDTGQGMTPEVAARIFEPFFTTKPRGEGTGLGLAGVYGTFTQAQGHVSVLTSPDEGSTFEIFLPCVSADTDADSPGTP